MADELDMEKRDPQALNKHVSGIAFEDVLGEPDAVHSFEFVWKCSYACYNCGLNCCYKFLTLFCACCMALYWGCYFACMAFYHIWCLTPCVRVIEINCGLLGKLFRHSLDCCLAPLCEVVGLCGGHYRLYNK